MFLILVDKSSKEELRLSSGPSLTAIFATISGAMTGGMAFTSLVAFDNPFRHWMLLVVSWAIALVATPVLYVLYRRQDDLPRPQKKDLLTPPLPITLKPRLTPDQQKAEKILRKVNEAFPGWQQVRTKIPSEKRVLSILDPGRRLFWAVLAVLLSPVVLRWPAQLFVERSASWSWEGVHISVTPFFITFGPWFLTAPLLLLRELVKKYDYRPGMILFGYGTSEHQQPGSDQKDEPKDTQSSP